MLRIIGCVVAILILTVHLQTTSAQTATPPAASSEAKPSKMKLTVQKLRAMKAKWNTNKPKLAACRKEVKAKGLAGDDRWFYIADCMEKT
ncbi:hypothetical protein [Bradyrhizobium sp. STM 3562]|uniref:hypothetical protein n=1 Tax=Bradyrhizobium sp. STM 3562 TaxID=578924 RepID=UPI00388E7D04